MSKMPVLDPYTRGYLLGVEAARKHGPIDKLTLVKLQLVADELKSVTGRKESVS